MRDNLKRYRAINKRSSNLPKEPQGNLARHLITLAGLINGIMDRCMRLLGASPVTASRFYLLTNYATVEEACPWYRKRVQMETFFSDQKSCGFNLHKSHLSEPQRLSRLMIVACLAYL
jgi:hypothetical protein